jgi:N-methylhydantoinase A/oxoprolinase/acetone carboxylase beta subunit
MRIGIDIGGTNTDAVLVDRKQQIVASVKVPTTISIEEGVVQALAQLPQENISRICIGSTHAINGILQCRDLYRVGVIRLNGNRPEILPSCISWPQNLRDAIHVDTVTVDGGFECDGRSITPFDLRQIKDAVEFLQEKGAESFAIIGAFSPLYSAHEEEAAHTIHGIPIALSHEIGGIGFLERENATILNSALKKVMKNGFDGLSNAIRKLGFSCPIFISQNNGSVISFPQAVANPILTLSAGATNSFVGGGKLSQLENALIVDIGGTSTDVGVIKNGYPRRCLQNSSIGGIELNFSAPDVLSIALGGGSHIHGMTIGPQSCGKDLFQQGRSFGGSQLTFTDIALAMGHVVIPHAKKLELPKVQCEEMMKIAIERINRMVDRMEGGQDRLPVVLVGGGSALIPPNMQPSRYYVPPHAHVANAYGAALGEISATIDTIVSLEKREQVLEELKARVLEKAGASSRLVDMQIIPYHYMPGNKARVILMAAQSS